MLLQYIHIIFLPHHDAIYFVKCTSPSCSKAPPQHDAATPVLNGWDGVLWLVSLPLFPPNITMIIMAKQFYFSLLSGLSGFVDIGLLSNLPSFSLPYHSFLLCYPIRSQRSAILSSLHSRHCSELMLPPIIAKKECLTLSLNTFPYGRGFHTVQNWHESQLPTH